jgi:hypothetical protein
MWSWPKIPSAWDWSPYVIVHVFGFPFLAAVEEVEEVGEEVFRKVVEREGS